MSPFRVGEWYFPDGEVVPLQGSATSFYRNRGDDGTVNLNRINPNITLPTGLFCCVLPDATDVSQTLCIDISKLLSLSQHFALFYPEIYKITYLLFTCMCIDLSTI